MKHALPIALLIVAACGGGGAGAGGAGGGGGNPSTTGTGGSAATPGLDCIGNVMLPTVAAGTGNLMLGLTNVFGSQAPVSGAHLVACTKDDALCTPSLAAGDTGTDGTASLAVPFDATGFDGYAIATKQGYFTTILAGSIPYVPAYGVTHFVTADQATLTPLLTQAFGVPLDAAKGYLLVYAADCTNTGAAGITVTLTGVDAPPIAYAVNGQASTQVKATDATGLAFAVNVAPGTATVETRVAKSNELIGKGTVIIRAGALSEIVMLPTP